MLKERIHAQGIDEESKYKCYIIFLDSRFRGNDKTEFPRKPEGSEACEARPTAKQSEAEGLAEPRRETRRGLGIGLLKPQVPGAAEETEGFRGLQGDRQGSAARGAKRRQAVRAAAQQDKGRREGIFLVKALNKR